MRKFSVILLLAMMALLNSCGNDNKTANKDQAGATNSGLSISKLSTLMNEHPEFSSATLKEIKVAAGDAYKSTARNGRVGSSVPHLMAAMTAPTDAAGSTTTEPAANTLDKEIAKEAQALIDKALDEFNLNDQLTAGMKMFGIAINMQRDLGSGANKGTPAPKDLAFLLESNTGNAPNKGEEMPTCEQVVSDPFPGLPKEKFEAFLSKNHDSFKSSLSGCAKIKGGEFIRCLDDLNKFTGIVNEKATCSMKNFDELAKIAEKEFNKSFSEIEQSGKDCVEKQFSECGFKMEMPENPNKQ